MILRVGLLGVCLFPVLSFGQSLSSLFPTSAHITNISVPFEVTSSTAVELVKVDFVSNQAQCKSLVDPHFKQVFHIRCKAAGSVVFKATYIRNGRVEAVTSPSLAFTAPAGGVISDPGVGGTDPSIAQGQALFSTNCMACHSPTSLRGSSASRIQSNINSVSQMSFLRSMSAEDVSKIAAFLGSL
jgi:hypothetical protein